MIHRTIAEEVTPDGVRRVRLTRDRQDGGNLNGQPAVRTVSTYLDGTGRAVLSGKTVNLKEPHVFEAHPARTEDVLDLGRLSRATQILARQMGVQAATGERPTPEQIKTWVDSYRGLLDWKKEAEQRMQQAQGQIDSVGTVLRQFL